LVLPSNAGPRLATILAAELAGEVRQACKDERSIAALTHGYKQVLYGLLMKHAEEWARQQGSEVVRLWSSASRTVAHRFYERLGYTNVKTQYSFVKPLDGASEDAVRAFIPRIEP